MPAHRITGAHEPDAHIEFEVPVKNRTDPLKFRLPKLHYFSRAQLDTYSAWLETEEGKVAALRPNTVAAEVASMRKLLEIHTTKTQFAILSKLTDGELLEISRVWESESAITRPESSASADS